MGSEQKPEQRLGSFKIYYFEWSTY